MVRVEEVDAAAVQVDGRPELAQCELKAEIAHDSPDYRSLERIAAQPIGREDIQQPVPVDDFTAFIDHDDPVAVTIKGDTDMGPHTGHG